MKTTWLTPHGRAERLAFTRKVTAVGLENGPLLGGCRDIASFWTSDCVPKREIKMKQEQKNPSPVKCPETRHCAPFWCSHVAHTSIHQNLIFIYGTFPSVLHYVIDFQAAFFYPRRKVKLLLSWLLKDGVYFKSGFGFTTNLTDFEDCFLSNLWSFLCFFRFTYINNINNNKYFYILSRCMCVCMCKCMHAHTTAYM